MTENSIFCPFCGKKTPKQNYCINCGKQIIDIIEKLEHTGKTHSTSSDEELIIATFTVSDQAQKSVGEPKNIFLTTNYILEDKGSRTAFAGKNMFMDDFIKRESSQEISEKIDINDIKQKYPEMKIIAYNEIEKAELYTSYWNTYLEITAPSFKPKYLLGGKKYKDKYSELFNRILKPKIGNKFMVK
ncbi:MAG: hypothetical protein ACP5C3_00945 [Methanomicrobiales archaeon]